MDLICTFTHATFPNSMPLTEAHISQTPENL
jgi:hypothetical protein